VNAHTQYTAIFAWELASYVAVEEVIRESEAAAAVMNLAENIMIEFRISNLKRSWYGRSL
jgi:hypothetical protein